MLHNNLGILLISETKIDSSFPTAQFQIEGYTIYGIGGGILPYIRKGIPSTLLNSDMSFESFYIEIIMRKKKLIILSARTIQIKKVNFKPS